MKRTPLVRRMSLRAACAAKARKNGPTAPKPRKPLKRQSSARQLAGRLYSELRRIFLSEHTICQAFPVIWPGRPAPASEDVHHVAGRGPNYLRQSTWLAVSRIAHYWIHAHPRAARALGLLK